MHNAICDHVDSQAFGVADGLVARLSATHDTRQFQGFGDLSAKWDNSKRLPKVAGTMHSVGSSRPWFPMPPDKRRLRQRSTKTHGKQIGPINVWPKQTRSLAERGPGLKPLIRSSQRGHTFGTAVPHD